VSVHHNALHCDQRIGSDFAQGDGVYLNDKRLKITAFYANKLLVEIPAGATSGAAG